jgi:hypothetical protein
MELCECVQVQDLIHPSLNPFVRGMSYTTALPSLEVGANEDDESFEEDLDDIADEGLDVKQERKWRDDAKKLEGLDSIYQWLAAEFDVSATGEVEIVSYINNLDRRRHGELYDTIASVFRLFLPLFAQVFTAGALYGRRLQVIVKAANYIVAPGASYEGSWHVEGMQHECIEASGIYYYSTTPNLSDSCLAFRDKRDDDLSDRQASYNTWFNINLGKVDTPEGRCLVFRNWLQHRVKGVENKSSEPGVRKILCFFLVNPHRRYCRSHTITHARTRTHADTYAHAHTRAWLGWCHQQTFQSSSGTRSSRA